MKKIGFLTSILLCLKIYCQGQYHCDEIFNSAIISFEQENYQMAIKKINAYKVCTKFKDPKADSLIVRIYETINQQKENAIRAQRAADKNARIAKVEKENAIKQGNIAQKNYLLSEAKRVAEFDPTKAIYLTKDALNYGNDTAIFTAQAKIYRENALYRLIGNFKPVSGLTASPNGKSIIFGSVAIENHFPTLYNLDGRLLRTYKNLPGGSVFAFSPDGRYIVSGTRYNREFCISTIDGDSTRGFTDSYQAINEIAFSPDGSKFAMAVNSFCDNEAVHIYDLAGHLLKKFYIEGDEAISIAFSPDGNKIITGMIFSDALIWDLNGKILHRLQGHSKRISSVCFSPNGGTIMTASHDRTIRFWDTAGYEIKKIERFDERVLSARYSPNGKFILCSSADFKVLLLDTLGTVQLQFKGHTWNYVSAIFSPTLHSIITADTAVRIWELTGVPINSVVEKNGSILDIDISPDNQKIITNSFPSETLAIRNTQGEVINSLNPMIGNIISCSFSPDGNTILVTSDTVIKLVTTEGNTILTFKGNFGNYMRKKIVMFAPNNDFLYFCSVDSFVNIYRFKDSSITKINTNIKNIMYFQITTDGKYFLCASHTDAALFDVKGHLISNFDKGNFLSGSIGPIAISNDNKSIAISDNNKIKIFQFDGRFIRELPGNEGFLINRLSFSPNNKFLLSSSNEGTIKLWDIDGYLLNETKFLYDTSGVSSAVFSRDGKKIIAGTFWGIKSILKIWNTPEGPRTFLNIDKLNRTNIEFKK